MLSGASEKTDIVLGDVLDLSSDSVLRHFTKAEGGDAPRTLSFLLGLDAEDAWAVDFDEHGTDSLALRSLIQEIENVLRANVLVLDQVAVTLVSLLAGLRTSRCMFVLHYVSQRNEHFIEALAYVLEQASSNDVQVLTVRRRLEAFESARLLGRIFSGVRLAHIRRVMGSYRNV